jgi:hypothetical protein
MFYAALGVVALVLGGALLRAGLPKGDVIKPFAQTQAYTFGVLLALVFGSTLLLKGILGG